MAASETAISAGCAFSVSVSVSAGPSNMMAAELLAERVVDLREHLAGRREIIGQRLAHADAPGCPAPERRMPTAMPLALFPLD